MKSIYLLGILGFTVQTTAAADDPIPGLESGPLAPRHTLVREQFLMGTRFVLELAGDDNETLERAGTRIFSETARLEAVLSNWQPESELSRLNRAAGQGPQSVSSDLAAALEAAARVRDWTDGAFDPTIEPLNQVYDLRGSGRAPSPNELLAALGSVGDASDWSVDRAALTARLESGTSLDLGGIGKGYALDHAAGILAEEGIADALLNFGGQVLAIGNDETGRGWEVVLSSPNDRDRAVAAVRIRNASISITGQSERYVEVEGTRIGHVLDPESGGSAADWGSVAVVASSATLADALSTGLFVMGPAHAASWIADTEDLAAIFLETTGAMSMAGSSDDLLFVDNFASTTSMDRQPNAPDPTGTSGGGATPPSNEELARRIEIVAEELETLKLGDVAETSGSVHGFGPGASKVYHVPRGVSLGGYGEALYENFSGEREDEEPSNRLDRIDYVRSVVYVGYKYDDRIVFNSELEFEHASTELGGSVSVEFANLDFRIDPRVSARVGLLLAPIGLTNELHEPPVYLGARRSETEQRVIPSTWRANGAGLYGEFGNGLSYRTYVMEGLVGSRFTASSGIRGGRQKGAQANADDLALAARVDFEGLPGLLIGASAYTGNSGAGARDSLGKEIDAATTVLELHGQYQGHGIRARALHAQVSIDEAEKLNALPATPLTGSSSIGEELAGSYLEVGYDVLPLLRRGTTQALLPYVRVEMVNTQKEVPMGFEANPANEESGLTFGMAYFPHSQVVLKADLHKRSNEAESGVDQWNLAAGYLF